MALNASNAFAILFFVLLSGISPLHSQNGYCQFDEWLEQDSLLQEEIEINEQMMQQAMENNPQTLMDGSVYTLPLVFHVIHLGEPLGIGSNISDGQLLQALQDLNDDFRDTGGTGTDVGIEFCLAERDPNGNFTTGINRVNGSGVTNYSNIGIQIGGNEVQVKALSNWPNTDYVNVWVVHAINGTGSGILGYAYFPGASDAVDGIVMKASATGIPSYSGVISHEAGHFLNLYHTFHEGSTSSCPPNMDCAAQGDKVCDTPPHVQILGGCNTTGTNSCDGGSSNSLFVHNHMNYSDNSCRNEFTYGQVMRMRAALMELRPSLINSLACEPSCTEVTASFTPSATTVVQGNSVVFTNTSTGAFSYEWEVEGQTFTTTNLTYTFDSPGFYAVCLRATSVRCTNQTCVIIEVQPIECPEAETVECEYLFNGDMELSTIPNGGSLHFLGNYIGEVCNWVPRNSTPYFCSDFAYNTFGLNHGVTNRREGIISAAELELEHGQKYLLSFEYFTVPAEPLKPGINPNLVVGLANTTNRGVSFPSDHLLLNFTSLPFNDNSRISNTRCHPPSAVYNQESLCFTYNQQYGKHLYFINTATQGTATVFVRNVSVDGCACDGPPTPCTSGIDFAIDLDTCSVVLTAAVGEEEGELCWDFGDGTTGEGPIVQHEYIFGGDFTVCLTQKCDPENAQTICKEISIPQDSTCNQCDTLLHQTAVICEPPMDSTDYYTVNLTFEVPKGFGPCTADGLFVMSNEVEMDVATYLIDDSDPAFDLVQAVVLIYVPSAYDFSANGATGYLTLCSEEGGFICREFFVEPQECDYCLDELASEAQCDEARSSDSLFVYEGSVTVTLDDIGANLCETTALEAGFDIVSVVDNGDVTYTVDYAITTTNPFLNSTTALLCFEIDGETYCVTLQITFLEFCGTNPLPTTCIAEWFPKGMTCTSVDASYVRFDLPAMSIAVPGGLSNYQLCDGGLFGTVEGGGIVNVTSGGPSNNQIQFDIEILIPVSLFVSGQVYNIRLYLCDSEGDPVCLLFPYRLTCSGFQELEERSDGAASAIPEAAGYQFWPNPARELLHISGSGAGNGSNRTVRLINQLGSTVRTVQFGGTEATIDLTGLPSGIYYAAVIEDGLPLKLGKIVVMPR